MNTGKFFGILLVAVAPVVAGAGDVAAGGQLYQQKCMVCHGPGGASVVPTQPILSGQAAEYTGLQMRAFRDGTRVNAVMAPMGAGLSDADIDNISAYLAAQTPVIAGAIDMALAEQGEKLYRGGDIARGLAACAACHGPTGAGLAPLYPRLSGQHAVYTESSLREFASGARRSDGEVMETIAKELSEDEIKQLAAYISGLAE